MVNGPWSFRVESFEPYNLSVRLQQCHFELTSLLPENRRTKKSLLMRSVPSRSPTDHELSIPDCSATLNSISCFIGGAPTTYGKTNCKLKADWIYVMCELKILGLLLVIFSTKRYSKNQSDICVSMAHMDLFHLSWRTKGHKIIKYRRQQSCMYS